MADIELENWMPMPPNMGPPFPKFLNVFWPWYEEGEPPPTTTPPLDYSCPYGPEAFETLEELISHVATVHPDEPPISQIEINWE